MEKYWFGTKVDVEGVCIQNGCISSMEALIHLTCNEGDTVLIPSPLYYSFAGDWWVRCQARIGTVQTTEATGYEPTIQLLEDAY